MFLDAGNGIITFDIADDKNNSLMDKVTYLKSHSIYLPGITAIGSYEDTLIVAGDDPDFGPFIIEFNMFKAENEAEERFHMNRAVYDITRIKKIRLDKDFAYLIGNNIHYVYRHSISNNLLNKKSEFLFEWIDRQANDIFLLSNYQFTEDQADVYIDDVRSLVIKDRFVELYRVEN